ncbi:hypothetical protein TVAG_050100 [Trichomonas vaginalis G3]|uniref:Uncharacterized protein n=1 Tax=Trichomonas vaginalis (strain ATCC PRA-98 / G3) TaxID=412133 RepID=A2EJD8_TRIV3|nr:hypothetical protein TVAGG3_0389420 [Trichomonas vaginalis G3]EAY07195.1 hypothetical protein TVAG_050100 [Trichomonas vaginalis G3]KAI5533883.1 hypothetical protein TVAGG3_0389420 [Trichomonas vaginalis G3]|eukprot:XP_001319418.1 hypothetical protein [Trichomonas vaginalis G3]
MTEEEEEKNEAHENKLWDAMSFLESMGGIGSAMKTRFMSTLTALNRRMHFFTGNREERDDDQTHQNWYFTNAYNFLSNAINLFNIRRFYSIFSSMTPDFTPEENVFANESDIENAFGVNRGGTLYLGKYSIEQCTELIRNSKFNDDFQRMGYPDWYIEFDLSDCFTHLAYVFSRHLEGKEKYIAFLAIEVGEFQLKETSAKGKGTAILSQYLPKSLNLLNVKWLSLQDPLSKFSAKRPRLPGQRFPGTGAGRHVFEFFIQLCTKSERDGIVNTPEHFHNAFIYEGFLFLDADVEGNFRAMKRDLASDIQNRGLAAVSWAIYLGFLRENDTPVKWKPEEQAFAISEQFKRYFDSPSYNSAVNEAENSRGKYHLVWEEAESYCFAAVDEFSERENVTNV